MANVPSINSVCRHHRQRILRLICLATLPAILLPLSACSFGGQQSAAPAATATAVGSTGATTPQPTPAPVAGSPTPQRTSLAAAYRSYEVGAYYFSGWSHGVSDNITPQLAITYTAYQPLIGWYDDSQSQVDKNITLAASYGIDFFAFDWFDLTRATYPPDKTLNEALHFYLSSRVRSRLKFCLTFIDQNWSIPTPRDWQRLVATWISYFKQPDYLRVDGKPLFIVFSPEHMRDGLGGTAGVHRALAYFHARARAAGLPGVTIAVAATVAPHFNPVEVQWLNSEGYDLATGYNYHIPYAQIQASRNSPTGRQAKLPPMTYQDLVDENAAMWNRVAANVHMPYMPVVTSGWDQRFSYREQSTAIIYAGRTPAQVACQMVLARHWIDAHPAETPPERIVMLYAWNEIGEGGAIVPTVHDGYGYVNAVKTVFGTATAAPATPAGCK